MPPLPRTLALGLLPLSLAPLGAADPIRSSSAPYPMFGQIERLDPELDRLLAPDAAMETLATGFNWAEGPAWMPRESQLVFSDVPENLIYRWREGAGIDVFVAPSGFSGSAFDGRERGSNGLAVDAAGRLVVCQHGNRRVARLDPMYTFVPLADNFAGHRFNSPNDLCFDHAGNLYFTDPPYGMQTGAESEIGFQGVYRRAPDGTVSLVTRELERPNGIGLSPDDRTLYVANSHGPRPVILAFPRQPDGTIGAGRVFFDSTELRARTGRGGAMDGLAVDAQGNLWATGPGGVLILSPAGKHLGTLLTGRNTGNCTFGGADGSALFITADDSLVRLATKTRGIRR